MFGLLPQRNENLCSYVNLYMSVIATLFAVAENEINPYTLPRINIYTVACP